MKAFKPPQISAGQRGFSFIEILVTLVITTFGLLALAGFVTKSTTLSADSVQRARAGALLADMVSRLPRTRDVATKQPLAVGYVTGESLGGGGATMSCEGLTGSSLDLCEWNNVLYGANDGGGAGALGYRGCVTTVSGDPDAFAVVVAWGALTPGIPPVDSCGAEAFTDDTLRRTLRMQVRIANLQSGPAPSP